MGSYIFFLVSQSEFAFTCSPNLDLANMFLWLPKETFFPEISLVGFVVAVVVVVALHGHLRS